MIALTLTNNCDLSDASLTLLFENENLAQIKCHGKGQGKNANWQIFWPPEAIH